SMVFEGRAIYGGCEHCSEQAQQSGRRISAADALPVLRLHSAKGMRKNRSSVSARSLRSVDGRAQQPSSVPLLRQLFTWLRCRIFLFSHLVHNSGCRSYEAFDAADECVSTRGTSR